MDTNYYPNMLNKPNSSLVASNSDPMPDSGNSERITSRHFPRDKTPLQSWFQKVLMVVQSNGYEIGLECRGSNCVARVLDPKFDRETAFGFHLGEERTLMTTLILQYCSVTQRDELLPGYELPTDKK